MSPRELIRRRRAMAAGSDGMTLVELLVAVVILGLAGTAIAGMFIVMTSTTFLHREQANVGAVLRSAAEAVNSGTYACSTTLTATYSKALFSVPVILATGSNMMTISITPSPFNAGAVGDLVADSGGSGSQAIPAGTKIAAVSSDGSTVTLSAAATGAPSGDSVMFYPPVVSPPTISSVTHTDGSTILSGDCSSNPSELVTIQVFSAEQRVKQTLSIVKSQTPSGAPS